MHGEPPQTLIDLLTRLNLATAAQVRAVAPRVRRLAGDLPDFESVWVDALQQARLITPMQASEINAGRGDELICGPYVLGTRLAGPHFAACYAARHLETNRTAGLYLIDRPQRSAAQAVRELGHLIEQLQPVRGPLSGAIDDVGLRGASVWVATAAVEGVTALEWMAENGRLPPLIALHVAREMLSRLLELERIGVVHGDLSAAGLLIDRAGQVQLPLAGVRGVVRPHEGYSFADLPPEGYDYLAPERIAAGTPPNMASDIYACGCLWWHLLTGRPPFAGGSSLSKLKAVHAARVIDVRQLAPEVPEPLALAISACLAREPQARPRSFQDLAAMLGSPSRGARGQIADCIGQLRRVWESSRRVKKRMAKPSTKRPMTVASAAGMACMLVAVAWWMGRPESRAEVAVTTDTPTAVAVDTTPRDNAGATVDREKTIRDPAFTPAAAVEPVATAPADLVLPGDKPLKLTELDVKPGQRVRGRAGKRPRVSLARGGLHIAAEDVCFESVDFVWDAEAAGPGAAMLTIDVDAVEFVGCSFSSQSARPPVALAWRGAAESAGVERRLVARDCVFRGLAAVVECPADGSRRVDLANSLCIAAGPIVRLRGIVPEGETLAVALDHVTTRGDCSVLEYRYGRMDAPPGGVAITVDSSALVTNPRGGLLVFAGAQSPEVLIRCVEWTGTGSLVTPETAMGVWRSRAEQQQPWAEEELDVGGLVRSAVEFAGPADGPPAASRITRWQAPLQSLDPPGANTQVLYLPAE